MYILFGIVALYFQAIVYEGSRYIFARLNKVEVEEFTIGIGFKIFSRKINGTIYTFKIIPLGGYIVFNNDNNNGKSYGEKSPAVKLGLCVSGIIMNIISVAVLITIISAAYGYKSTIISNINTDNRIISSGDRIISIDSREIFTGDDAIYSMNFAEENGIISIGKEDLYSEDLKLNDFNYNEIEFNRILKVSFFDSVKMGTISTVNLIKNTYKEFYRMIIKESNLREYFSTLCEIVNQSSKDIDSSLYKLLWFTVYINLTFICVNIIPLPVFDGGKIIIELINCVKKNRISSKVMSIVELGSFIAVILLIIFMII